MTIYQPKGFAGCFALEEAEDAAQKLGDGFVWQEKIDGERAVLRLTRYGCFYHGRRMVLEPVRIKGVNSDCVLDCEKVGETFHAFDALEINGQDITAIPLISRLQILSQIQLPNRVERVSSWTNPGMVGEVGEGLVAKDLRASYLQPHDWLRFKREITEDVLLVSVDTDKQSAEVARVVNGKRKKAGRIFGFGVAEIEQAAASIGAWVEVKAMELTESGKFRHGRFLRFRFDKPAF